MNSINVKVKNKLINSYSKKYLISSIENIINKSTLIQVSFSDYINALKSILSEKDSNNMNEILNKETIGIYQKGMENSIENIKKMESINNFSEWIIFTNEICFTCINSINCRNNMNNLLDFVKNLNLLELNVYNFSETKIISLNLLKENTIADNRKEIEFINKMIYTINKLYLKYLKMIISSHKEWFQRYDFYENFYAKLESNRELVDLYTSTMKLLMNKVDKNMKLYIYRHIELLKDKSMNSETDENKIFNSQDMKILSNTLQFFNIVSLEEEPVSLYDVCSRLFNIENSYLKTLKDSNRVRLNIQQILHELMNVLNIYSKKTDVKHGLIIFYKNNNDIFYDISKLLKTESFENVEKYKGINRNYINLYNNLKQHVVIETVFNNDMCININVDRFTEKAFVLHTNTMKGFKIQTNFKYSDLSIDYPLIKNIIRNTPSKRIENYNNVINKEIESHVDDQLQRKYNDFINLDYANQLGTDLYKKLLFQINNNMRSFITMNVLDEKDFKKITLASSNLLTNDNFFMVFNNTLVDFYKRNILMSSNKITASTNKNIDYKVGNADIYLTCISESEKISKRIKKEIIDSLRNKDITVDEFLNSHFPKLINNIINPDLSIYDKIIEKEYKIKQLAYFN